MFVCGLLVPEEPSIVASGVVDGFRDVWVDEEGIEVRLDVAKVVELSEIDEVGYDDDRVLSAEAEDVENRSDDDDVRVALVEEVETMDEERDGLEDVEGMMLLVGVEKLDERGKGELIALEEELELDKVTPVVDPVVDCEALEMVGVEDEDVELV